MRTHDFEDGQFDDAEEPNEALKSAPDFNPREGQVFIDEQDPNLLWSESEEEEEGDDYEVGVEVDEEDWEIAEKGLYHFDIYFRMLSFKIDFTKQYNRMKQHLAVQSGSTNASTMKALNTKQPKTIAPLPAVNKSRQTQISSTNFRHQQQLDALSKYSSKIANIDAPYTLRAGVNPKGASQTANLKDKSDRATSEQVLDPRTRIILFKMIGRGLVSEINGCVSTGKEVRMLPLLAREDAFFIFLRRMSITLCPNHQTYRSSHLISHSRSTKPPY